MASLKNGIYRHFKRGELYMVLGVALDSETLEELVVYKGLYDHPHYGKNALWIRPLSMFQEHVSWGGKKVPRFEYVSPG